MVSLHTSFPPVPEDTFLAATALYGKGNIYLRLGDALEQLLKGLLPTSTKTQPQSNRFFETHVHPALLTIFQYIEELTNEQIIEAVRGRLELKYALHLPLNSPGTSLNALCDFHQSFFATPEHQQFLQSLLDRVVAFGLVTPSQGEPLEARRILATICTLSQLDDVTKAMYQALEALAVTDPEWLRKITRPYWYDRYNRCNRLTATSFSDPRWSTRAQEILGDIQYLLQEVDQRHSSQVASLPEIQHLKQILQEQFLTCIDETDPNLSQERMVIECNLCTLISEAQKI
jgi:transposase